MTTGASPARAEPARPPDSNPGHADESFRYWTAAAFIVALGVRLAWVAWVGHQSPAGLFDPARYAGYAAQIARGKGYIEPLTGHPTAYYPPGYPWFLGVIAWLQAHGPFGDFLPLAAGLVQAVLGAVTAVFAALIGRRLVSPAVGIVAAFLMALYPNLVFHTGVLLSETLYNFLFLAFLVVLLQRPWPGGLTNRRVAAAAALFGLAVLVRPISVAVVPVLAVVWWIGTSSWRIALRWTAITMAVVVALILPWTVRNAVRMNAFVPISTNTGDNLCIGHAPGATGKFRVARACDTGEGVQDGPEAEVRSDHTKTRRALRFIADDPGREPYLIGQRAYYMFRSDADAIYAVQSYRTNRFISIRTERLLVRLANWTYAVVAVVGVIGLLRLAWRGRADRLLLVLCALATAAVPLLFFGDTRFKVPVMPMLVIGAACAVVLRWPATET